MRNKKLGFGFDIVDRFNCILDELNTKYSSEYLVLDDAILIWCNRLSIDKIFPRYSPNIPPVSQKIKQHTNQWIQNDYLVSLSLKIYRRLLLITDSNLTKGGGNVFFSFKDFPQDKFKINIKETKNNMSNKMLLLIAFVLTGVGLLLFLLNKKEKTNNSREYKERSNTYLPYQPLQEKYVLALLINGDRNQKLIQSLKNSSYLKPEDSRQLYNATQALWIGSKTEFERSKIKSEFNNSDLLTTKSEYDVYFVSIELNEIDPGFKQNANQMDRIDAFKELANKGDKITVSERLLSKAYENTEFYSR